MAYFVIQSRVTTLAGDLNKQHITKKRPSYKETYTCLEKDYIY